MSNDTELDKNETATPHKLAEARKRGQVSKSADVVSAVVFGAAVIYLYANGWDILRSQFRFDRLVFSQAATLMASPANLWQLVAGALRASMTLLAPLLITVVIAAVIANLGQTGAVFTFHPVKPDWNRINPATGMKRLFSFRTLFDAFRTCAKLIVLVWVVYEALRALAPQLYVLAGLAPLGQARLLVADGAALGIKLALALAVIAAIDFGYSSREFAKRQRMSKREVREEHKHREGDPRIRSRLRELRKEALKRSLALRNTKDADVLVTNPTHYAVALRYRHGEMAAPKLVAKGAGAMALAMRGIAARHRIPVVQNRSLARGLYAATPIDHAIPNQFFPDVARLMVWILAMRDAQQRNPAIPPRTEGARP